MTKAVLFIALLFISGSILAQAIFSAAGKPQLSIQHILVTGQSNALGSYATPVLSDTQPYNNKMFVTGTKAGGSGLTSLVPLIEQAVGVYGESTCSSMANTLSFRNMRDWFLVSNHASDGIAYSGLKKGTTPYANGQAQVTAGKSLVQASGKRYRVGCVTVIHGEADSSSTSDYDQKIIEWQNDYQTDSFAISGQGGILPMIMAQLQNAGGVGIPQLQWNACKAKPDRIFIACPRYFLPYRNDNLHHVNPGYRWMGEYFAKAYESILKTGNWLPLSPASISRSGAVITINFNVPAGVLVFDTDLVSNPGNYGFTYTDDSSSASVSSVAITGAAQVQVTLNATPTGTNKKIQYAYSGAGGPSGARGNLRDTDSRNSLYGSNLYNWCIHFNEGVN